MRIIRTLKKIALYVLIFFTTVLVYTYTQTTFIQRVSEISKTEDSITNLRNSKVKRLKRLNIFRHDLQTTTFLTPNKSKTKNQSIETNLRPISKIKVQHNEPKQNKKKDSANIENVKHNQPYVIKRHVERYKRSGSSFSLDMRRHPAIIADDLNSVDDWWKAFTELTTDLNAVKKDYRCLYTESRGNWWDCNSYPYKAKTPCLVYSFGVGNDFRFDDAMATLGCEVHSFDPSMKAREHVRKTGVNFYKIGIGNKDDDTFLPWNNEYTATNPKTTWKIKTLSTIMSMLGHTNRSLDILKLDIEGYEWDVLGNILRENLIPQIKQLEIEYHIFPNFPPHEDYVKALQVYQALWFLDLKRYYTLVHQNHQDKDKPHLQADVAYVNSHYKN